MTIHPVLCTARLELRPQAAADLAGLVALIADQDTRRFLGPAKAEPAPQFDRLLRNAGSWALYGYGAFAVRRRGEAELIASCGIFHSWRGYGQGMDDVPEAGWIVRADWAGQGIAREAMEAILQWFDEAHGPQRIVCMIEAGNLRSERLAAPLGFSAFGRHRIEEDEVELVLYERLSG